MQRGPTRRSPVMADVAEAAGVSHQTVSRVLNGHPHVREETRAKVLWAVERLGYRRNMLARALATRRSRTLGAVVFGTTLYGPASTLYGVEQAARGAGYFVSVVNLKTLDGQETQEALSYLADQGVDGIIVVRPQRLAGAVHYGMPLVVIEGGHAAETPVACVDQMGGARSVTEHLLELGHETVWHVSGAPD